MSKPSAVAAVTATLVDILQNALDAGAGEGTVTTLPPGRAAKDGVNRVNLFLYEIKSDGAWTNVPSSVMIRPGEPGKPSLALVLHYLLTPFVGIDNPQVPVGELLLGYAMAALNDNPVLSRADIRAGLNRRDNDLDQQQEHVRVTWQPLSVDDLSRLWSTFQADYRTSVGYAVSPVLIDSSPPTRVPMPVLHRGAKGHGPEVVSTAQPYPVLESAELAAVPGTVLATGNRYASGGTLATPGAQVVVLGRNLARVGSVELTEVVSDVRVSLVPDTVLPTCFTFTLPADLAAAGIYTLAGVLSANSGANPATAPMTNVLPLAVAPAVQLPVPLLTREGGTQTLTLQLTPGLAAGQSAMLLVGSRPFELVPGLAAGTALTASLAGLPGGEHLARVRVAGLDSDIFPVTFA